MLSTVITFAGNLTSDPELRFTTTGKAVASFRVLVNRRTRNDTGEWVDGEPTGHNCTLWGPAAENLVESVVGGDRLIVHGRVETESWTDRTSGEKRTRDVVNVDEVGPSLAWAYARPQKAAITTTAEAAETH